MYDELTAVDIKKMEEEIEYRTNVLGPKLLKEMSRTREFGDLSENAEYDAAKEAQGMLELKIAQLKELVVNARILDPSKIDTSTVQILTKVHLLNVKNNQEIAYTIVPETEANLREKKISVGSPIAKGLLGHKVGETVDVNVPAGVLTFTIKNITID